MSREIKFRALYFNTDKSRCEWAYGLIGYMGDKGVQVFSRERNADGNTDVFNCLKGTEGQFTGLRDKNGKELYHDDVVMLLHGGYAEWQPCHVVADDFGTPGFIPIGEPIFLTFERYFMESKAPRAAFEIISNIHEHPELLNQTGH